MVASGGLLITAHEYGVAVIVLAMIALVGLLLPESRTMQREAVCPAG